MNRQNRILGLSFLLLFTLAMGLEQPWRGDAHQRTAEMVRPLFPQLSLQRQQIDRIEIESAGKTTTLLRGASGFVVGEKFNHPAANQRVVDLIDNLSLLDDREVVAQNDANHRTFGVEDGQGTRIRVMVGEELVADLVAGALRSQDLRSGGKVALEFYLRVHGSDLVVLARNYNPPPTAPEDWLRVALSAFSPEQIQRVERLDFQGDNSWNMERTPGAESWSLLGAEPGLADSYQADSWVFSFGHLEAADVIAKLDAESRPDPEYDFTSDLFRVFNAAGEASELQLGGSAPGNLRYAWIPGSSWLYAVNQFEVDQLRQVIGRQTEDQD